jgi:hypothetical protein
MCRAECIYSFLTVKQCLGKWLAKPWPAMPLEQQQLVITHYQNESLRLSASVNAILDQPFHAV